MTSQSLNPRSSFSFATMKAYLFSLAFLFCSLAQGLSTKGLGTTVKVFHVYSSQSPFRPSKPISWEESVLQMMAKDQARLQFLSSLVAKKSVVPIASGRGIIQSPSYIVKAKVGTPPQTLLMALDNSYDAAWIPCKGCVGCSSTVFNTVKSTTFKTLGCGAPQCKQVPNPICGGSTCTWNTTYGSSTILSNLTRDTIALSMDPVPNYAFGCIQKATGSSVPPQGLLGFGRGPLSFLSQTQNLYKSTFSYCLPSFRTLNFSGSLRLGPVGQPPRIKTTPLLKNPRRSSLYYVNLNGIRVGRKIVDIPRSALAFNPTTGAGTIFDSGTVFTRLVAPAYTAVRNEFRKRVGNATVSSLGGFDTCYSVPIVAPTITFMFSGMNVTMPPENLLIHSTAGVTSCLAMAAAPDNVNSVLNVIASMQQQNHRILFDVPNSRLGVAREQCS
ncbi:aspartyl protease AED3-like [Populus nigra]|uniref:aspartyl protease AED3-like n=1 Tax=Populus nigra TaxID=3691 RepID=UPI002B277834|nr:aspartyl protease AED3-like [Populus nigra]